MKPYDLAGYQQQIVLPTEARQVPVGAPTYRLQARKKQPTVLRNQPEDRSLNLGATLRHPPRVV